MQNSMCDLRKFTRPLPYKITNNDSIVKTFYIRMGDSPTCNKKSEGGKEAWFKRRKIRSLRGIPKLFHFIFNAFFKERIFIHFTDWKWSISYHIDKYKSSVKKN